MDRLEQMIARLVTQRACLDHAAGLLAETPGFVLEVGLGKGRTYDHLRTVFPDREIYVFDRDVHAPQDVVPDEARLSLGDFRVTLPEAIKRLGRGAVLAHADIGTSARERDAVLAAAIAPALAELVRPGGLVITDRDMERPGWSRRPLPGDAGDWTYYIYRVER